MAIGQPYDLAGKRVFVAGHRGMVGSALVRRLARERCEVVVTTRAELDTWRPPAPTRGRKPGTSSTGRAATKES